MNLISELGQLQYQRALMEKIEDEHNLRVVKVIGTDALCVPTSDEEIQRIYKLDLRFGWLYMKWNCDWRDDCPIRLYQ